MQFENNLKMKNGTVYSPNRRTQVGYFTTEMLILNTNVDVGTYYLYDF